MKIVPVNQKDGYKADHRSQYPDKTEFVYSNFTPRSTKYAAKSQYCDDKVVVFGLQYFIKWFLMGEWQRNFFDQPKEDVLKKYKRRMDAYLGPILTIDHIGELHDLGYLPISIKALPEGTAIDARVPMLTIENTLPEFFWLTNFFESVMSCMLWKPCTSATAARHYRSILDAFCEKTGGDPMFVQFQGHDFSFRGMSGIQDAEMSSAGHLLSFSGTDTIPAIDFLEEYYNADCEEELIGVSVPATEHSVMCMGNKESEIDTFRRLINDIYPTGIVSIVSDTWDYWKVLTEYLPELKDEICARDGKVVIRPDSGDPADIICGTCEEVGASSVEGRGSIEILWDEFGGKLNDKGYKELDPHIGLIYGDSITIERCIDICERLEAKGFCSTNVVFGIGSYTYEYCTRDTYGFAMKATYGVVDGEPRNIFKDPKTDDGMKKSAKGLLSVIDTRDGLRLIDEAIPSEMRRSELEEVYRNGVLIVDQSLGEIKKRINGAH